MDATTINQLTVAFGGLVFTVAVFRAHRWIKQNVRNRQRASNALRTSIMYRGNE